MSIQRRLLLLTLAATLLVWLGSALLTYRDARHELDEMLDAHLAQAASLLVLHTHQELEEVDTEHAPQVHRYAQRVAFQIWEQGRTLRLHSADAPDELLSPAMTGFSDHHAGGADWRVFSTWDQSHSYLIQVAERADVRDDLARRIVQNLIQPLWVALPLLGGLIWLAVATGLRPLAALTGEIARRAPDNLAAIDLNNVPREVNPLVGRLNSLFERIRVSMENERRFTADAAHELRTPVAAIKAQVQVARSETRPEHRQHALDQAVRGCDNATHLIAQLLTLARLDAEEPVQRIPCDLATIVQQAAADHAPEAIAAGSEIVLCPTGSCPIQGEPTLLAVLMRNLLHNAIHHTPAGSLIEVRLVRAAASVSHVVHDNGPGLSPEALATLSQRFYRPPGTAQSGSGLGLSIVRRIAEIHQATLKFENTPQNSGFKVTVHFISEVQ